MTEVNVLGMSLKYEGESLLKKFAKIFLVTIALLLTFSTSIFASNSWIRLVVNGQIVPTDVAPKIENGRVLVPISTISKALGAEVLWDSKEKRVFVIQEPFWGMSDVWSDNLTIYKNNWIDVRNLISSFIMAFDLRDHEKVRALVTKDYDSDFVGPEVVIPVGGQYPVFIDYNIVDATKTGTDSFKVRVEIIKKEVFENQDAVIKQYLDFDVIYDKSKGNYFINGIWKAGNETLQEYTVFPGLTYKTEKY